MLAIEHLRNYFLLLKHTGDYELAESVGASLAELEKLINAKSMDREDCSQKRGEEKKSYDLFVENTNKRISEINTATRVASAKHNISQGLDAAGRPLKFDEKSILDAAAEKYALMKMKQRQGSEVEFSYCLLQAAGASLVEL